MARWYPVNIHLAPVGPMFEAPDKRTAQRSVTVPSIRASVLVTGTEPLTDAEIALLTAGGRVDPRPLRCHSFVTDGRIQFLEDCTHALKGQTVELEPF